jgi:hypothetical protein
MLTYAAHANMLHMQLAPPAAYAWGSIRSAGVLRYLVQVSGAYAVTASVRAAAHAISLLVCQCALQRCCTSCSSISSKVLTLPGGINYCSGGGMR